MPKAKQRSVKFNFVMNSLLTASGILYSLITFPYISRVLLVEGNGKVAFAASVISYFTIFSSLGIPIYGIRACARVRDDRAALSKVVQELLIINTITVLLTFSIFAVSISVVPKFREEPALLWINSLSLFLNCLGVNWLYSALEQYSYITVRALIFKVISVALIFLLVQKQADYVVYAGITVFATGGSNLMNFFRMRRFVDLKHVGKYEFRQHLKPIFFFFASTVATSIYTNLDTVMLGFMSGDTQVGFYNTGIRIKTILIMVVTSLGAVLLPRLSYYVSKGMMEEFKRITVKAFNFILVFAVSVTVFFTIFAKETILFLAGPAFLGAVAPMQLLMPAVLCIGISHITGLQMLTPLLQEKKIMVSYVAGAILDFSLNWVLIPTFGASGASFSTMLTELLVVVMQVFFLRKLLWPLCREFSLGPVFLAVGVSGAVSLLPKFLLNTEPFLALLVGGLAFYLVYVAVLLWKKEAFTMEIMVPYLKKILKVIPKIK